MSDNVHLELIKLKLLAAILKELDDHFLSLDDIGPSENAKLLHEARDEIEWLRNGAPAISIESKGTES